MLYIIVMDGVGITVSHVILHLNPNLAFSHRSNRKNLGGGGRGVLIGWNSKNKYSPSIDIGHCQQDSTGECSIHTYTWDSFPFWRVDRRLLTSRRTVPGSSHTSQLNTGHHQPKKILKLHFCFWQRSFSAITPQNAHD